MQRKTQQQFNWTRAAKLRALDAAGIYGANVASVLRVLDSFAGKDPTCWPKMQTIADRMGVSVRTARRAVRAANHSSLLIVTPRNHSGQTSNLYQIVWSNLHADSEEPPGQKCRAPGQRDLAPGQSDRPKEAPIEPPNETPISMGDGNLNSGGWPHPITDETLRSVSQMNGLFQHAVEKGWLQNCDVDRTNFFALAVYARRVGKNPGGLFTSRLKKGGISRWEGITAADESKAVKAIKKLSVVQPLRNP